MVIPRSVATLADGAFAYCDFLRRVYFQGDAPNAVDAPFDHTAATLYYPPDATGWSSSFAGRPAVLFHPRFLTGARNGQVGFTIAAAAEIPVVVEACPDLAHPVWTEVTRLVCGASGTVAFTDPDAVSRPRRSYRFRAE